MTSFQREILPTEPETDTNEGSADYLLTESPSSRSSRLLKRSLDVSMALFFFFAFGWLYLFLWLGVISTSGLPGIYSQQRFGAGGRIFKFYKFRSMVTDSNSVLEEHLRNNAVARKQWQDFQKLDDDPRITKFGAFIRRTSLDELPQFWNVLIGDMSLVGPRPCMINQKNLYGSYWSMYCAVRPGITGLWQVSGRNHLTFSDRVKLDVEYVRNFSIRKDLSILFRTVLVVVTGHGSR